MIRTFMLDGLALPRRRPFSDGAADEDDEFLNAGALEKPEAAEIRSAGQNNGIGTLGVVFHHHQRRDLHHLSLTAVYQWQQFLIMVRIVMLFFAYSSTDLIEKCNYIPRGS